MTISLMRAEWEAIANMSIDKATITPERIKKAEDYINIRLLLSSSRVDNKDALANQFAFTSFYPLTTPFNTEMADVYMVLHQCAMVCDKTEELVAMILELREILHAPL